MPHSLDESISHDRSWSTEVWSTPSIANFIVGGVEEAQLTQLGRQDLTPEQFRVGKHMGIHWILQLGHENSTKLNLNRLVDVTHLSRPNWCGGWDGQNRV